MGAVFSAGSLWHANQDFVSWTK